MALANSLKRFNPQIQFIVSLVEKEIHPTAKEYNNFDYIVLAKDLGFPNFEQFIFKHSIVEASTSVKGQLFQYLLNQFPKENKFVYLDPDILVFSELSELDQALDRNNIVLTPHLLKPGNIDMEISSLKHGSYNLGFLAIKRSKEAESFINWWSERLNQFCYDDIPNGIFTDQKWIDLAPSFFDVYILKHHGYNFATWSLMTTKISKIADNYYAESMPLRFFHFSGFDSGTFWHVLNLWVPNKEDPGYELGKLYQKELNKFGQKEIGNEIWSYDYFESGEKIERETRIIYRKELSSQSSTQNPFSLSNQLINLNYKRKCNKKILPVLIKNIYKAFLHPKKALKVVRKLFECY
jgi:hypothetical protein